MAENSKIKVTLHPAYMWDCEGCGMENFTRGIVPCLSDEEIIELREVHMIEPWEIGCFIEPPARVTCRYCGKTFETQHRAQEE